MLATKSEIEDNNTSVWILITSKEEEIYSGSSEAWKMTWKLLHSSEKKKKKRNYIPPPNPPLPITLKNITGGKKSTFQVFSEWKFGRMSL